MLTDNERCLTVRPQLGFWVASELMMHDGVIHRGQVLDIISDTMEVRPLMQWRWLDGYVLAVVQAEE